MLISKQGRELVLKSLLERGLELCLFRNNRKPTDDDTEKDYKEANFNGYSRVRLMKGMWDYKRGSGATANYPTQIFESNSAQAPQDVYGCYIVIASTGEFVAGDLFTDGPYRIRNKSDKIEVGVELKLRIKV
jgi:hypothetical protein